jgi:hypothetical protein
VAEVNGCEQVAEFRLKKFERIVVMPLSRQTLERQLQAANADIAAFVKTLQTQGLTEAEFKRNTRWRSLNANIRAVRRRLAAVTQTETNNAAVAQHKSERLTAAESK